MFDSCSRRKLNGSDSQLNQGAYCYVAVAFLSMSIIKRWFSSSMWTSKRLDSMND